jgi:hypothetical protein
VEDFSGRRVACVGPVLVRSQAWVVQPEEMVSTADDPAADRRSPVPPRDWRLRLVSSVSGLAVGLGINALSTDVGYRGPAVLFAFAGVRTT